jgi:hypothetical protein
VKKPQKILLLSAILIAVITTSILLFWFEGVASIDYWLDNTYQYQKVGDQWIIKNFEANSSNGIFIPINCKNNGAMDGTFDLFVTFTNASFLTATPQPNQILNDTSAKFTFTLHGGEKRTTEVYFSIENNTDKFTISLSLESKQSPLRIENAQKGEQPWQRVYRALYYSWIPKEKLFAPVQIA